jgi:hypothetical protein
MSKHEFNVFGLPTHELPLFTEKTGRDWVDYGFDNQYGDYLRDLYLGSSIQAAVVNGVSEMIYGDGLDATDREEKPEQWLKTQKLLENSDEDIMRQLCFDLKLYGQCYVQVIWNRVRTEVAETPFSPSAYGTDRDCRQSGAGRLLLRQSGLVTDAGGTLCAGQIPRAGFRGPQRGGGGVSD